MATIKEIKKRMGAVGTIERITKTMQMIATAKFTAALQRSKATRPYAEQIRTLVSEVAAAAGDVEHPLLETPPKSPNRELLLVISSDRGMCGAYNGHILRQAMQIVRDLRERGREFTLETSGKKAIAFFKFQKIDIADHFSLGDKPSFEEVNRIATRYIDRFTAGEFDRIRVISMRFISNSKQVTEVPQLLPLAGAASSGEFTGSGSSPAGNYEFSPSSEELLADLLPQTVKTALFQAFIEAVVSEQIMRMIAMKGATENAKDLGKNLKRSFNRLRQSKITTELTEIISGAAALE